VPYNYVGPAAGKENVRVRVPYSIVRKPPEADSGDETGFEALSMGVAV